MIEAPGNPLCFVNDLWQRHVTDMGIAGPDRGEGGKYLFLPPGHGGDLPEGYVVVRPPTFSSWVLRALSGTEGLLQARSYPLSAAAAVGTGSQYVYTAEDSTGVLLDGARGYTLTLPGGIPAKNFWSVTACAPPGPGPCCAPMTPSRV
ncbi:DUF1254 domain-containing protein [Streptomyces sp. F63]|uniref:DUF1254 domain-containing protein n=1 Tax=Streptomyces sp. F63 TaxID=2824887 RepID=UPI001B390AE6|nr:DUF1254 domain-containing protein [Streptomyces sp. F63]MBQ0986227.1 DUF1254 domain-containing protein [Streptomyces sp. F63]